MLTHITPEHILAWDAGLGCSESLIPAIYKRSSVTPKEILDRDDIPAGDRLWVVLRPEVMGERSLRLIACDIAETVLPLYEARYPGDDRPRRAIETARRYAAGEATQKELDAAWDAAWGAADTADAWAARHAAWAAEAAAAAEADRTTAWDAVKCAVDAAAWGAARDAATSWAAARAAADAACCTQWTRTLDIVRGYLTQEDC